MSLLQHNVNRLKFNVRRNLRGHDKAFIKNTNFRGWCEQNYEIYSRYHRHHMRGTCLPGRKAQQSHSGTPFIFPYIS